MYTCTKCNNTFPKEKMVTDSTRASGVSSWCRNCQNLSKKRWKLKNKEIIKEKDKIYRALNKSSIGEKCKKRYHSCELRKKRIIFRKRTNAFLKGINKSEDTISLVGCSREDFILHLEGKFKEGMCWDNYGNSGWTIDHIIPLISAKNLEELRILCHYRNIQPLWIKDNLEKGTKIA